MPPKRVFRETKNAKEEKDYLDLATRLMPHNLVPRAFPFDVAPNIEGKSPGNEVECHKVGLQNIWRVAKSKKK